MATSYHADLVGSLLRPPELPGARAATPAQIEKLRATQVGHRVDGIVGGLAVKEEPRNPK